MLYIIEYYGGYLSLEKLREDTLTNSSGTTAFHIIEAFKKYGFDSYGVLEHDITSTKLNFPLIAHLVLTNGLEHFVVVENVLNNTVFIMDPAQGRVNISVNEFNKVFSNNIVIVVPKDKIINMEKSISIFELFINIIKKEKFLISKILISAFLTNILLIIVSYYLKIGSSILFEEIKILKFLIFLFGILVLLKVITNYIKDYYLNHFNNLIDLHIYPEFLRHIFFLPSKLIKRRSNGEIVTRIGELTNIKNLFTEIFLTIFLDFFLLVSSVLIMISFDFRLFLIVTIITIIYVIFSLIISKILHSKILENINYQTEFNSITLEYLEMFESIKHLNIYNNVLLKIEEKLSNYLFSNYDFTRIYNVAILIKDFLIEMCFFIVNSYGLLLVYKNDFSIVNLFTFNMIMTYYFDPIKNITNLIPKYNYIKISFSKISEFIDLEEEKLLTSSLKVNGDITFKSVSYSYNEYDYILKNVNFNIKNGEHVQLVGNSGSGKSTICKLIYKLIHSNCGEILIDGKNIEDLNISTIRNNIVYISQEEEIFTASIKDNIKMDRDIDENTFNKISEICLIDEIVSKKKARYNYYISPSSKNISGGEKQRIILARGLLKEANIIMLDEALSELDLNSEKRIISNIRKHFSNKTIIYISHKNFNYNFERTIRINDLLQS